MKKIALISVFLVGTLFANESSDLDIEKAVSSLNKATSKLIEKYQNLENELVDIKIKIREIDSIKSQISNKELSSVGQVAPKLESISTQTKDISSDKKVYVNTWSANLREKPLMTSKILKNAKGGDVFTVVDTLSDFYLLDNGLYLHKSIADAVAPVKLYVKKNGVIDSQSGSTSTLRKVYEGDKLSAVGLDRNNSWYILVDGGFIDKNLVEIEG